MFSITSFLNFLDIHLQSLLISSFSNEFSPIILSPICFSSKYSASASYPTIVPEQLIGASHVLLNHQGVIDFKNHAALMKNYFDIVPVDELGYIMVSQSVDSNHRLFDIANTTTIHAVERGHSIEKSMDEIIS